MSAAIPPVHIHGVRKDNFTFTFFTLVITMITHHGRVELQDFTQ